MKKYLIVLSLLISILAISQTSNNLELDEAEYAALKEKSLRKVNDLSRYINVFTDKTISSSNRENAVDGAVKLFNSEENLVQVSSANNSSEIKKYKVRKYFNKIRILNYSKIDISWYDIQYVSNLKQGPDGKYYGVVTIFQKFKGYDGEGNLIYSDVTQKNIEIIIDVKENARGEKYSKVYLGDISVVETK